MRYFFPFGQHICGSVRGISSGLFYVAACDHRTIYFKVSCIDIACSFCELMSALPGQDFRSCFEIGAIDWDKISN